MNPDEYQNLKEIYNSAVKLKPEDRAAFLDQKCPNGDDLRVHVERLLASCDSEFLETPVNGHISDSEIPVSSRSGQRIGHYEVLRRIGAGGMGMFISPLTGSSGGGSRSRYCRRNLRRTRTGSIGFSLRHAPLRRFRTPTS